MGQIFFSFLFVCCFHLFSAVATLPCGINIHWENTKMPLYFVKKIFEFFLAKSEN